MTYQRETGSSVDDCEDIHVYRFMFTELLRSSQNGVLDFPSSFFPFVSTLRESNPFKVPTVVMSVQSFRRKRNLNFCLLFLVAAVSKRYCSRVHHQFHVKCEFRTTTTSFF